MKQTSLFNRKINIPLKNNDPVSIKFKVGKLDFKLFLTHIEVGNITDAVSVTLTVNNTVYNTISFTVEQLSGNTYKNERVLMNSLFNSKVSEYLLERIYKN